MYSSLFSIDKLNELSMWFAVHPTSSIITEHLLLVSMVSFWMLAGNA